MELITKVKPENDKKEHWKSFGIFFCPYCKNFVKKRLEAGLKQKSCGCMAGIFSSQNKIGKKLTEEHKQKITESGKGKKRTEEQNRKQSERMKGKKLTEKAKQKIKVFMNSENNPNLGKKVPQEQKAKQSLKMKGKSPWNKGKTGVYSKENLQIRSIINTKELNPAWLNGISFEPYSPEFNREKKQQVLERDNYECQNPNCEHLSERLDCHHIDYDKKNNNLENLIALCNSCHSKTNGKNNRQYWTEFYQNIMANKI